MAKKTEKITLAYCPEGECAPIFQAVPVRAVDAWVEGILGTDELIVRPTVFSGIQMICKKHDNDEHYNWVASCIYLHNRDDCIGGDAFLCRVDYHKQPDGKIRILGLTEHDKTRINSASDRIFKNHKRLEIEL